MALRSQLTVLLLLAAIAAGASQVPSARKGAHAAPATTTTTSTSPTARTADAPLHIWLLPHSHCDTGWLYTVEGYWKKAVHSIIGTVVAALDEDSSLRFVWSEVKWIQMFWNVATDAQKAAMKRVVKSGQFEFVGAGWSQHDEVTTAYFDQVGNEEFGHQYLANLGFECPQPGRCMRCAWQIDMFAGYSGATTSLQSMSGYDATYMRWAGTDAMLAEFSAARAFEFVWEPSSATTGLASNKSRGESNRVFAHVIHGNYGDLAGLSSGALRFTWDVDAKLSELAFVEKDEVDYSRDLLGTARLENGALRSAPGEAVDDSNVAQYAELFLAFAKNRSTVFQGPFLAVWGSDYRFTDAAYMFGNMSKIVAHINEHPELYNNATVRFTTLAEYTDYVHSLDLQFPLYRYPTGFEYGWPHVVTQNLTGNVSIQYQTGALVSRAAFKLNARQTSAFHVAAERAAAIALAYNVPHLDRSNTLADLNLAWDAVGLVQHHDSMTGTMSAIGTFTTWGSADRNATRLAESLCTADNSDCQALEDYTARLSHARSKSGDVLASALGVRPNDVQSTHLTVFNPLAKNRATTVAVSLKGIDDPGAAGVGVVDAKGHAVTAQLSLGNDTVYFVADVKSLASATFDLVTPCGSGCAKVPVIFDGAMDLNNADGTKVTFSESTGLPATINGVAAHHRYAKYHAEQGGPYVLIETAPATPLRPHALVGAVTALGPVLQEVKATFDLGNTSAGQLVATTRVYAADDKERAAVVELEHSVPGNIGDDTELIMQVSTGLATNGSIWTDESGLETYKRVHDPTLPISGNYHSLVMSASLCEEPHAVKKKKKKQKQTKCDDDDDDDALARTQQQLSVLTQHTMGVASLQDGHMEYMFARNIVNGTDDQGPWPLRQLQGGFSFPVWVLVGDAADVEKTRLPSALRLEHPLVVVHGDAESSKWHVQARLRGEDGHGADLGALQPLPEGIHLLSFHARQVLDGKNEDYVVRVQNVVENSGVKTVNLAESVLNYKSCEEMTLSLQQPRHVNDVHRLTWPTLENENQDKRSSTTARVATGAWKTGKKVDCTNVALGPLDIRTFILTM